MIKLNRSEAYVVRKVLRKRLEELYIALLPTANGQNKAHIAKLKDVDETLKALSLL